MHKDSHDIMASGSQVPPCKLWLFAQIMVLLAKIKCFCCCLNCFVAETIVLLQKLFFVYSCRSHLLLLTGGGFGSPYYPSTLLAKQSSLFGMKALCAMGNNARMMVME